MARNRRRPVGPTASSRLGQPRNRWSRAIDRSPTVSTALAGFAAHLGGALLVIIAMWTGLAGLLLVVGEIGTGWHGRAIGVGVFVGAVVAFVVGRWALTGYAVEGPR